MTKKLHLKQLRHKLLLIKAALSKERIDHERIALRMFRPVWNAWLVWFSQRALSKKFFVSKANRKPIEDILYQMLRFSYDIGAITGLESMGFPARLKTEKKKASDVVEFGLSDEEIIDAIRSNANRASDAIIDETVVRSRKELADILESGGSFNDARDAIARYLNEQAGGYRSWLIARTEFQIGLSMARHDMFVRSGVRMKFWQTVGDDRVREEHLANEAQGWIPIDEEWQNGAMHPGDYPSAINCRCAETAQLDDPDILLVPWDGGEE